MKTLLLDTHILLWALLDDALLKDEVKTMIKDKITARSQFWKWK